MTELVIPMTEEDLRVYEIEIESDFWLEPDVQDDYFRILHTVKDHTCKTDNSSIKKYLAVRWVIQNQTALLVDGVLLDMFSANIIYQVVQYLMKEKKKDIFFKMFSNSIQSIATTCLKVV